MISRFRKCLKTTRFLIISSISISGECSRVFYSSYTASPLEFSQVIKSSPGEEEQSLGTTRTSDIDIVIASIHAGRSDDEFLESLIHDQACNNIQPSYSLVDKLLRRFKDDWKSAFRVFRWAESHSGYKHLAEAYDMMVDILGKSKQMDKMSAVLKEMREGHLVTLNTVAIVMRRYSGAGQWEDAARIFDEIETFGLKKNTESMNLLLDTLCKEKKVQQAREIFLELKSHIQPNAHTFNIFIHGWCIVNRVDEAQWTIQEMKGYGCRPCVISYSTIVEFYSRQYNFSKVYELLDDMEAQGLSPNVITYTTIMCSLAKSEEFEEAIQIAERMKLAGCKPDTLFYNCLIHTLGRAGRLQEAVHVFEVDMPRSGVNPNTSTYNSMIAMFCHRAQEQRAFDMLKQIEDSTLCKPDVQTYYPLLKSCFKTGKTDSYLTKLLNDMINKHCLSLDISSYSLLIHGLCRANKCHWAYLLFEEMLGKELKPRYQTCCLLLDECKQKNMYDAVEKIENFMRLI